MGELLKLIPGLALLGGAYLAMRAGYVWPWGWAVGVVVLCAGIWNMGQK